MIMAGTVNRFAGVKPGGVQTPYFEIGNFKVRSESMRFGKRREGGDSFYLETTVLESDNPACKPGSRRQYSVKDTPDTQGFILTIIMAFMGMDPCSAPTDEELKDIHQTFETFVAPPELDPKTKRPIDGTGNASKGLTAKVYGHYLHAKDGSGVVKTRKNPTPYVACKFMPDDEVPVN